MINTTIRDMRAVNERIKVFTPGLLLIGVLLSSKAVATNLDAVPIPDQTKLTWIAEQIRHNGVPMVVQQLNSSLSLEEILAFYREQWEMPVAEDMPGYIENTLGDWQIISRLEGDMNVVVQLKNAGNGGSEGFLSALGIAGTGYTSELGRQFPKRSGTELVSSTDSQDIGKSATTLLMKNNYSVKSNSAFYKSELKASGWKLVRGNTRDGTAVLMFNNTNRMCELAIRRENGETIIFANIVAGTEH